MPLFECSKCHCVENTACSNYSTMKYLDKKEPLCSECDPDIGEWHGRFKKRSAVGMLIDQDGLLWSQEQVDDPDCFPRDYKVVGRVELKSWRRQYPQGV